MTVIGADLYPNQSLIDQGVIDEYVSNDELYARADLISLHAFLNNESYHMVSPTRTNFSSRFSVRSLAMLRR